MDRLPQVISALQQMQQQTHGVIKHEHTKTI